jgi:ATP-dependent DNA ligase
MLARSGTLPTRGRWAYEVKWDGFRAIVRAGGDYRIRSRRGRDMTALVPELHPLPAGVYDGELVAFDGGIPWFPDVCARLLNGDRSIRLVYMVFDLLALNARSTMRLAYSERRRLLEEVAFRPRSPSSSSGSTMARLSSTSCGSAASRASSRSGSTPATPRASAAG